MKLPNAIDREIFPGMQGGPHMHSIAAKAVAFYEAAQPAFAVYAQAILKNASVLADELMKRGFKLVTNGTDNHMIQTDMMAGFGIDGRKMQDALDKIGLSANCNAIPNDTLPPFRPSGLRLGTPAMTTRGLTEEHMPQIAEWMLKVAQTPDDATVLAALRQDVTAFARQFPLPSDIS